MSGDVDSSQDRGDRGNCERGCSKYIETGNWKTIKKGTKPRKRDKRSEKGGF
jgi:hypothetical protein